MLTSLTQKICPLVTLSALMLGIGCGKKMAEPKSSPESDIQQQLPNSVLSLNLNGSNFDYQIDEHADFQLPRELRVNRNSASTAGKAVSVYYNVSAEGDYEVKCVYKGNASGDRMQLNTCYNYAGGVMGTMEQLLNSTFFVDKGRYIKLQTTSTDLDVQAIYQMRWAPSTASN